MSNRVCEILGIEKPVISAAMTWLTDAEFVAAVSEAGVLGIKDEGIINCDQAINNITAIKTCREVADELNILGK